MAKKEQEIIIVLDDMGYCEEIFVSPELAECAISVIDLCDDPEQNDIAEKLYEKALRRAEKGRLVHIDGLCTNE